jgi:hypothetical protein
MGRRRRDGNHIPQKNNSMKWKMKNMDSQFLATTKQ